MITRIAAVLWTIFILVMSLMPKEALKKVEWPDIINLDKIGHLVSYALFVFLWSRVFDPKGEMKNKSWKVFIFSILMGVGIEYLQWQMNAGRHFEYYDIIANIMGSILGLTTYFKINKT